MDGIFYKIDSKEYKVFLTYCKPVDDIWVEKKKR